MRRLSALVAVLLSTVALVSCGDPGPMAISIAPIQMASGENHVLAARDTSTEFQINDEVNYVLGGQLPPVLESAMSLSFQPRRDTKESLKGIAEGLGVLGEIVKVNKNYLTLAYDENTGAGMQLWIDAGGGWWSYDSGRSSQSISSSDEIPPAKNLPTPLQAIKRVSDVLVLGNQKPNNYTFSVQSTPQTVVVTGHLRFWRMTSNIELNFVFGENSKVLTASGPMVKVENAYTYPLVTPEQGIARLKDPRYAAGGAVRKVAIAASLPEGSNTTNSSSVVGRTVTITNVHLTLMQVLLSNGTYMLLPSYTYFDKDGEVGVVLAVQEKYLVEGKYPTTSVDETVKQTDPPNAGNSSPGSPGSGDGVPPVSTVLSLNDDNSIVLIGYSETAVKHICEKNGWTMRVVQRDNEVFQVTQDYSPSRLNVRVEKGIVTAVTIG